MRSVVPRRCRTKPILGMEAHDLDPKTRIPALECLKIVSYSALSVRTDGLTSKFERSSRTWRAAVSQGLVQRF